MTNLNFLTNQELQRHFIQKVIDFPEGCPSGKEDFLNFVGLSVPEQTISVTVSVDVTVSGLADVDECNVGQAAEDAINDNFYLYDGEGNHVDASVSASH